MHKNYSLNKDPKSYLISCALKLFANRITVYELVFYLVQELCKTSMQCMPLKALFPVAEHQEMLDHTDAQSNNTVEG